MKVRTIINRICIVIILASVVGMGVLLPGVIEKFNGNVSAEEVEMPESEMGEENESSQILEAPH